MRGNRIATAAKAELHFDVYLFSFRHLNAKFRKQRSHLVERAVIGSADRAPQVGFVSAMRQAFGTRYETAARHDLISAKAK